MIVELIIGWLVGQFVAKNKKMGFIIGAICGAVWGFIACHIVLGMEGDEVTGTFLAIMMGVEALIAGLMALIVTHAKMKKRAKSMQNFTEKFD